nr:hypothetical protein [uncultured Flavobacterium sp.]
MNGNLVKLEEEYSNETFEYDNKNGILKNVKTPQWAIYLLQEGLHTFYLNNVIKSSYENTRYNDSGISEMIYEYNTANYPVKIKSVSSEDSNTAVVSYIKK